MRGAEGGGARSVGAGGAPAGRRRKREPDKGVDPDLARAEGGGRRRGGGRRAEEGAGEEGGGGRRRTGGGSRGRRRAVPEEGGGWPVIVDTVMRESRGGRRRGLFVVHTWSIWRRGSRLLGSNSLQRQ